MCAKKKYWVSSLTTGATGVTTPGGRPEGGRGKGGVVYLRFKSFRTERVIGDRNRTCGIPQGMKIFRNKKSRDFLAVVAPMISSGKVSHDFQKLAADLIVFLKNKSHANEIASLSVGEIHVEIRLIFFVCGGDGGRMKIKAIHSRMVGGSCCVFCFLQKILVFPVNGLVLARVVEFFFVQKLATDRTKKNSFE